MKRILIIIFGLMTAALLFSCGPGQAETTAETPTPTIAQTAAPTPALPETPAPEPVKLSYTTGLPFDGEYKPVIAVIENSSKARPQIGLQAADVVYEIPVEGITRFLCVFSDNVPEEIAPVRSARVPFLYVVREWDAAFMHCGGSGSDDIHGTQPQNVYSNSMYKDITINMDEILPKYSDFFYRDPKRPSTHNVVGYPRKVQEEYDYQPEPLKWLFDEKASYTGENVMEFSLSMCSAKDDFVSYSYDPQKDVYYRSMSGKEFISAETGEQVSVKNIIVQYSTYKLSSGVKLWKMTGSGDADIYIGGKMIHGSWERKTKDDETVFRDNNGDQIVLRPGNTWIHISPED